MGFDGFATLFVISLVVVGFLHYGMGYYIRPGWDSFFSKVMIGWFGAFYGGQYFGQWFEGMHYGGFYVFPAVLGSFGLVVFAVDMVKTFKS